MKANPIQCYFVACQAVSTGFVEPSRIAVRIPTLHCFKGHVPMETSTTIYIWIRIALSCVHLAEREIMHAHIYYRLQISSLSIISFLKLSHSTAAIDIEEI